MLTTISSLIGPISSLLDKIIPDKDLREKLSHDMAQIEVNKVEAAHRNMFVAGWRPAIGWICALGMAGNFLIIPFVNMGLELTGTDVLIPMIQLAEMMPVLMGMLGLGAMRSFEKAKGVSRER